MKRIKTFVIGLLVAIASLTVIAGPSQQMIMSYGGGAAPGQQAYTSEGTYSWTAPAGVTSVSVVAVGPGGSRNGTQILGPGAGGGLGYKNNITVVPGQSYTVVVGTRPTDSANGTNSYFINESTVMGGAGGRTRSGGAAIAGTYAGDGGGNGGAGGNYYYDGEGSYAFGGGGGAGGYAGNGGNGASATGYGPASGASGSGGGGGGGGRSNGSELGEHGGGVGINGQGTSGAGGSPTAGAGSGGGGTLYGGGVSNLATGSQGAVRIIWPGNLRQFPSTRTANE